MSGFAVSKKLTLKSPTEYIYYKKLHLPKRFESEPTFIKNLRESVSIQVQGDAVELSENADLPTLMVALDVVRKVSPEAVLVLQSGEKILLFDHQLQAVLRPKDIITEFVGEAVSKSEPIKKSQKINIESEWKLTLKQRQGEVLRKAFESVRKKIKDSKVTTLIGSKPKALFLLAQYFAYPISKEIRYQEERGMQPLVIYK